MKGWYIATLAKKIDPGKLYGKKVKHSWSPVAVVLELTPFKQQ